MKPPARKILSGLLVLVCLFCIGRLVLQKLDQKEGSDDYQHAIALAQSATVPATETQSEETVPMESAPEETQPPQPMWIPAPLEEEDSYIAELASIDLDALRQVNPDVVGWICIPDTKVNYPLMQGEDNTFYLEHTWEGNPNFYGSIYMESRNSSDFTDFNTILYGHNMLDGSMFGLLPSYAYTWFWRWNPYVYVVTDQGVFRYEVFASYSAEVDSPTYGLSFNQLKTREDFIAHALENNQLDTGITPAVSDRILTLSTCTGVGYESRRVVQAYLKMIPADPA